MEIQALFKCRKCKISAESSLVNSDEYYVRCRRCCAVIRGQACMNMIVRYSEYLSGAEIRYDAVDPVRMAFMRMNAALHPDRYPFADLPEPQSDFFISLNDYFRHRNPINE